MDTIFLDTSAFLKLYIPEQGSNWLTSFIIGKTTVISELALFESAATLARLYRGGTYTKQRASGTFARIYQERFNFDIVELGSLPQLHRMASLVFNLPVSLRLRTLDAIHLTAATSAQNKYVSEPFFFVSADVQLLRATQSRNFNIENPENHP